MMSSLSVQSPAGTRTLTMGQAVNEALAEELRRDERVFIIGEDIAEAGTPFKILSGLVDEFGPDRILDSPISEAGITGLAVGAAMTGMRPVVDIMFGDFLTLVMDQLANQAAKAHYMSGGKLTVPLVLRTTLGATRRSAAQHSQSLQAWVAHIPGLKVVLPSTPADAKGLLKTAIRDDNPVVFIEDKLEWQQKGEVPDACASRSSTSERRMGVVPTTATMPSTAGGLPGACCGVPSWAARGAANTTAAPAASINEKRMLTVPSIRPVVRSIVRLRCRRSGRRCRRGRGSRRWCRHALRHLRSTQRHLARRRILRA